MATGKVGFNQVLFSLVSFTKVGLPLVRTSELQLRAMYIIGYYENPIFNEDREFCCMSWDPHGEFIEEFSFRGNFLYFNLKF